MLEFADIVFLAVKPQYLEAVLTEIRGAVRPFQVFVSLAPGKTLDWLSQRLGSETKLIRTMPNTPGDGRRGDDRALRKFTCDRIGDVTGL